MKNARKYLVAAIVLAMPSIASAQAELPTAKEVLAKFVKATGGKEAFAKIKTYTVKAKFLVPARGLKGDVHMFGTLRPNQQYQTLDLGQFGGKMERAFTGKAAWEISGNGTRRVKGLEMIQAGREASLLAELTPEKFYKAMKVEGKEKVGEEECYKVVLTPNKGKPETAFYSVKSGLKVKVVQHVISPQGEMKIEALSEDYRKVGDVMMAFKTTQKLPGGMTFDLVTEKVEFNKQIDKSRFEVPDAITKEINEEVEARRAAEKAAAEKGAAAEKAKAGADK